MYPFGTIHQRNTHSGTESARNLRSYGSTHAHAAFEPHLARAGRFDLIVLNTLQEASGIWRKFQKQAWHSPFQEFNWVMSWRRSLPKSREIEPVIVIGYDQARIAFILPLMRERVFGVWRLSWLAGEVNDINAPLIDPDVLDKLDNNTVTEIWRYATRSGEGTDTCHLLKQPALLEDKENPFVQAGAYRLAPFLGTGSDHADRCSQSRHSERIAPWTTTW